MIKKRNDEDVPDFLTDISKEFDCLNRDLLIAWIY